MAVTTTPSKNLLLKQLVQDFPQFRFAEAQICYWSPDTQTIFYCPITASEDMFTLLHELSHALLGHTDFTSDIQLIRIEVEAWEYARKTLSKHYGITIPDGFIQEALNTYRSWIHTRSQCPTCHQNGLQTKNDTYSCINCRCRWRVNDARQCQLKRYTL